MHNEIKTVRELSETHELITNHLEIEDIEKAFGLSLKAGFIFVKYEEGFIGEIWVGESNIPYMDDTATKVYKIKEVEE